MGLNEFKKYVMDFEKEAGFDSTDAEKLIEMTEEEIGILKSNLSDKAIVDHELMDLFVLILQLANRYGTDLDSEWGKHWENSSKYLKD